MTSDFGYRDDYELLYMYELATSFLMSRVTLFLGLLLSRQSQ
jgi:hypothetical protein